MGRKSPYKIEIDFEGGLSDTQKKIFGEASNRWMEVISMPQNLNIKAKGIYIDGPGGILGQAGPTSVKPGTLFPDHGKMEFDTANLSIMENDGALKNVILHEMGHVLGIGVLWRYHDLIEGSETNNPLFVGENAMREYGVLLKKGPTKVPIANTGGPGTREGHWRETTFGNELMSGYTNPGILPLSRLTIGMLEDMSYKVNYEMADPYILPNSLSLKTLMVANEKKKKLMVSRPICQGLPK